MISLVRYPNFLGPPIELAAALVVEHVAEEQARKDRDKAARRYAEDRAHDCRLVKDAELPGHPWEDRGEAQPESQADDDAADALPLGQVFPDPPPGHAQPVKMMPHS